MAVELIDSSTPLRAGDIAPPFMGTNQLGNDTILYGMAGSPVVLLFYPELQLQKYNSLLCSLARSYEAFVQLGVKIIAIGLDKPASLHDFHKQHSIPYPLLSVHDMWGSKGRGSTILQQYHVIKPSTLSEGKLDYTPCMMLIDANSRIRKIYPAGFEPGVDILLAELQLLLPAQEVREVHKQAPVLFIDNVLSHEECRYLIDIWDKQGNVDSGSMKTIDGKTVGVYNYDTKIRRDHFIKDEALLKHLDTIMHRRVFPQIRKAFHFDCTRREDYKIACYDAARGGYFRKHRDNTTAATAHRIWAMSLNLNVGEYEGGYLTFPEYSNYRYKPETGTALIFSGSMMHEASDVYEGKRFVLLQFFYGEAQAEIRQKNSHLLQEPEVSIK